MISAPSVDGETAAYVQAALRGPFLPGGSCLPTGSSRDTVKVFKRIAVNTPVYWPYDEVQLRSEDMGKRFVVETPWLRTAVGVKDDQAARLNDLAEKFSRGSLGAEHLSEVNWFFQSLSALPLCYILPRRQWQSGLTAYGVRDQQFLGLAPADFLRRILKESQHAEAVGAVAADPLFGSDWNWDLEGALQFAKAAGGIDPIAFFSVVRRYHLLSSVDDNRTEELYEYVRGLGAGSSEYRSACALMVRQNHYVTSRCGGALAPALETALTARGEVKEFIDAEFGHDRILDVAIKSMGIQADAVPVTHQSKVLMDLLEFAAGRNFLAFAMAVDFFERSSYQKADPLAMVLNEGGLHAAARQLNKHMDINDAGGHENVALGFLSHMGPIGADYAEEAIRIAEAVTHAINRISYGVHQVLLSGKPP